MGQGCHTLRSISDPVYSLTQNKGYYAVQGYSLSSCVCQLLIKLMMMMMMMMMMMTNRKPAFDFLSVIKLTDILSRTVSKLSQIIV